MECDDIGNPTSEDDECCINSMRYLTCEEGEPCGCTQICEFYVDDNQWRRWIVVRWMDCDSDTPGSEELGDCGISGAKPGGGYWHGWKTPCVIETCVGELDFEQAETMGRLLCSS